MESILNGLKQKMSQIKEKYFTKHEKQHSEKFYRIMDILNNYSFIWHALLSMIVVFLVELASRWSIVSAFQFIAKTPIVFFYNSFIVFASLTLVYLCRRRAFARIIICSFWIIMGIINGIVLSNRVTPFGFADLTVVSDLLTILDTYISPLMMVLIIVASLIFIFFCTLMYIHGPIYKGKQKRLISLLSILTIVFIAIPATTTVAQEKNIVASYFTNIAQGYKDYGFVYSFSSGFVNWGMNEPENYDEAVVDALMEAVETNKAVTTVTTENGPNIITVLLESFVDPNEFNFMTYSKDPTPFYHYLEDNFTSGYLTMPVVGAGTANAEFEILTGMKLHYFGTGEYPYKTILKDVENCESIASYLTSIGYGSHVVHNNGGNFYSRVNAFSKMGFETFTSKELMDITEFTPNEGWAEDCILAEETMKTLTSTEGPDLTYVITVGQHGVYPEEPVIEDPYCEIYGVETEEETNAWTYYMHQANKTDQFMQELVTYLEALEEDTIVVFWGDHLPTMGLEESEMVSGDIFKSKYVTWNNFGLEQNDKDLYAYQLMADIFNQVGVHDGTMMAYHQTQSENPDQEAYLSGIEQLQYDILYGERFCYNGDINKYPASDIIMGIDEVVISDMVPLTDEEGKEWISIKGESFTQWSRVYVNDDKIETFYISGNELWVEASKVDEGDKVVVNQNGSNSTIFRSSNEFFYGVPIEKDIEDTELIQETESTENID